MWETIGNVVVNVLAIVASAVVLPFLRRYSKKVAGDILQQASDAIDKAADTAVRYADDKAKAAGQELYGSDKLNAAIDAVCASVGVTREEAEIAVRAAYARYVESGGEAAVKKGA